MELALQAMPRVPEQHSMGLMLRDMGGDEIGEGAKSTAYHMPNGNVVKYNSYKDVGGYATALAAQRTHMYDPFAPKVYALHGDPAFFYMEMEHLTEFDGTSSGRDIKRTVTGSETERLGELKPLDSFRLSSPFLMALTEILREIGEPWHWDLHTGNLMFRSDGQGVIVDPVYGDGLWSRPAQALRVRPISMATRSSRVNLGKCALHGQ
jgi:hypothetical protein